MDEHASKSLEKSKELKFKMYIDFDSTKRVFNHNYYFDEFKFVLKVGLTYPLADESGDLIREENNRDEEEKLGELKWERFDLSKYIYLLYYE